MRIFWLYGNTEKPKQGNRNKYVWKENRWLLWQCDKWTMTRNLDFWRDITICTQDKIARSVFFNYWDVIALWLNRNVQYFLGYFELLRREKCPLQRNWRQFFIKSTLRIFLHIFCIPVWNQIRASPCITLAYNADCRYYFHVFSCSAKVPVSSLAGVFYDFSWAKLKC